MAAEALLQRKTIAHAAGLMVPTIRLSFARGVASGWPDLLLLMPNGKPLFVELKAPRGVVSPMQKHRLKTLTELGYDVAVVYNFDQAREAIARALQRSGAPVPKTRRRSPDK